MFGDACLWRFVHDFDRTCATALRVAESPLFEEIRTPLEDTASYKFQLNFRGQRDLEPVEPEHIRVVATDKRDGLAAQVGQAQTH